LKARYAIVALHLGDPGPATRLLALREDPIHRTAFIHSYGAWHADLAVAAEALRASSDEPFRSGLCAALGLLSPEDLPAEERDALVKVFNDLYLNSPDGGTHSAAGWALRTWKQPIPAIEQTAELPADRRWHVNRQGMTLIEIPAGKFELRQFANGQGTVTLTRSFLLCDREVTIEQFQRFVDDSNYPASEKPGNWDGAWKFERQSPDCPVQHVSWYDAILYSNWLSKQEGKQPCYTRSGNMETVPELRDGKEVNVEYDKWDCDFAKGSYRLPTEAEWEYACRAMSAKEFCFGGWELFANEREGIIVNPQSRTGPGDIKLPNAWGLFDMHGNVWEWCHDRYGQYAGNAVDPVGAPLGASRVNRGGLFHSDVAQYAPDQWASSVYAADGYRDAGICLSAFRGNNEPATRRGNFGFRLARSSVEEK
jgi:eukaryotic-like serine/threonine-protein kinase